MATSLQVVSPNDLTTVIFDMTDPTGANSGLYGGVVTGLTYEVDWGHPEPPDQATPRRDPSFYTTARATCSLHIFIRGGSTDQVVQAAGVLAEQFSRGCVLRWAPNGSSRVRYIDTVPSNTPALLDGRAQGLYEVTQQLQTPAGVELQFQRYPFMREQPPAANLLTTNATMIRDQNDDGTPNGWSLTSTPTLTIDPKQNSLHVVAGAAGRGVFQATPAASFASGDPGTVAFEVKVTSGTVAVILDWRTAADATISNTTTTTTSPQWVRFPASGTAPGTTDHIRARIESSGAAATFDVRYCKVEKAASASDFCTTAETVAMDPAGTGFDKHILVYNPGTAPSPCVVTAKFPDASSAVTEIDYGLLADDGAAGTEWIADYLNATNFAQAEASGGGWTAALGLDTTNAASTGASTGNAAHITHATDPTVYNKRVSLTRTTRLDSLRGRWGVFTRVKAAGARVHSLQLRWSAGASALETLDEVTHDTSNATAFDWAVVYLGEIELPTSQNVALGQITAEVWTHVDTTASALDIDHVFLIPSYRAVATAASDTASQSQGFAAVSTPPLKLAADPVWVAGTSFPAGGYLRLGSDIRSAAGAGGNTNGFFAGTGARHLTSFNIAELFAYTAFTYVYGVANITDGDTLDASGANTQTTASIPLGHGYVARTRTVLWTDEVGDKYQPRIGITVGTDGATGLYVFSIADQVVDVAVQNQQVRTDPGSEPIRMDAEKLDSAGSLQRPWEASRVPFWIPPGLSLISVEVLDAALVGYNEALSVLARTALVTATVYPRYWS